MSNCKFIGTRSKADGVNYYLEVFAKTSLQETQFIELGLLQIMFSHRIMNMPITLHGENSDGNISVMEKEFTLTELLADCEEVCEYAREFHPEFVV